MMTPVRSYVAGAGAAGSLVVSAALLYVLAGAFVSFHGWPGVSVPAGNGAELVSAARATQTLHPRPLVVVATVVHDRPPVPGVRRTGHVIVVADPHSGRPAPGVGAHATSGAGTVTSPPPAARPSPTSSPGLGTVVGNVGAALGSTLRDVGVALGVSMSRVLTGIKGLLGGLHPRALP